MSEPSEPNVASEATPHGPAPSEAAAPQQGGDSNWAIAWRQLQKNRLALAGVVVVALLVGMAVFAPLLANGRPLHVRAYLTHLYDTDVAAFLDWHQRLIAQAEALQAGLPAAEAPEALARLVRYREGLPRILARIAGALDAERAAQLRALAADYQAALSAQRSGSPGAIDLDAVRQQGAEIEARFCRLSLPSAYKAAAAPLLEVPLLTEAAADARAAGGDSATLQPLARRSRALAAEVGEALVPVLTFLGEEQRPDLEQQATAALGALERLDAEEPARVAERVRALEEALDAAAEQPVPPALQRLPLVTRWPAVAALSPLEVAAMALYLALLALALLHRRVLALSPEGRRLAVLAAPAAALLVAIAWALAVPAVKPPAESLYKTLAAQLRLHPDGVSAMTFAPVPFGENENIYADRVTPPALWERLQERDHLAKRLRVPGEVELSYEAALERLDRLRTHWLGTDDNGRDVLARLIYGSRISLSVGFVAVGIYVAIGLVLGALAGYFGGWIDVALMRFTEIVQSLPSFFLIITVIAVLPPSIWTIMLVIGFTHWTEVMRLVRGEFLRLRSEDFVTAGRALGFTPLRVVFRHMVPNALGPVFVAATFGVAGAILIESALSFLGFGVPQPTASWGSVLNVAFQHEKEMWWITIFPGVLIFVTITAYNLVGEGLRDALDPKLRH